MQGGIGDVTRELARVMAAQGHAVHVFTREQARDADEPGIEVSPAVTGNWGWSTNVAIKTWAAEKQLHVVNIQFQTAAYNMHPSIHWLPECIRTIPVVVTFHDLRVPYLFPKAGPVRKWIVWKLARQADGAITTNHADENTLRDEWHIRRVRRIPIGNSIATDLPSGYDRQTSRATLSVGPDDLLIGYFGFLNHSKGALALLEALRQLIGQGVRAHLVMIGGREGASDPTNASYAVQVDAIIRRHDLAKSVHWTGFLDDAQVSACFHDCDLIALPYLDGASLRRSTLMVALAHGRAIISTTPEVAIPELADAIETVPPGDAGRLAEAMLSLWQDPARREALERAAGLAARQFGWEGIARSTIDFFNELTQ